MFDWSKLEGRALHVACPPEDPDTDEDRARSTCIICCDTGLFWSSHERPWSRCGYCERGERMMPPEIIANRRRVGIVPLGDGTCGWPTVRKNGDLPKEEATR